MEEPVNQENIRNPNGTFKEGISGNPLGRPKGKTLKEYQGEQFRMMSDEEKEKWLEDNKVSGDTRWKMAEGLPKQDMELSGELTSKIISVDE